MHITKTIATTNENDFSNVKLAVTTSREVVRIHPNGGEPVLDIVTSKVITPEEFKGAIIDQFKNLQHFDQFVDPETGHEIMRGVVVHEGVRKCFIVRYDELTYNVLKDTLKTLEMTKIWDSAL